MNIMKVGVKTAPHALRVRTARATSLTLALIAAFASSGCGEDGPVAEDTSNTAQGPLYVIGTSTFGPDGSNAYLRLVDELDLEGGEVSLDEAREFPGLADIATHAGSVLVASGDAPTITRFDVSETRTLEEAGRVSFASYGLASAAFWNNQFVSEERAYMVNGSAEIIVWNPSTMTIDGTIALPTPAARTGLNFVPGLSDRASVVHEGKYYLPMYWTDDSYADRSDDSLIVVVDVASGTVETTISAPCPGLDYGTVDDQGILHFSNWTGGAGTYYVLGTAQNCVATLDPSTQNVTTMTFASITGGHEGAAFKYAGDGKFVLSVFDEVRADAVNADEPFGIVGGLNWRLWMYDPSTDEATPVNGVDWNSGAIIHAPIGDRVYSMVPGADYASTMVYSLGDDGSAAEAFAITGWSFRLFEL